MKLLYIMITLNLKVTLKIIFKITRFLIDFYLDLKNSELVMIWIFKITVL